MSETEDAMVDKVAMAIMGKIAFYFSTPNRPVVMAGRGPRNRAGLLKRLIWIKGRLAAVTTLAGHAPPISSG